MRCANRTQGIEIVAKHVEAEEMTCDWTHRLADDIDDALAVARGTLDAAFTLHVKTLADGSTHVGIQELNSGWRHAVRVKASEPGAIPQAVQVLMRAWCEQDAMTRRGVPTGQIGVDK